MRLTELIESIKQYPTENQRKVKFIHLELTEEKTRKIITLARKKAKKVSAL